MRNKRMLRVFYSLSVLAALIVLLIGRLAWVQLVMKHQRPPGSAHTLLEVSMLQRERGLVLDSGRGHFTDRSGVPLTGRLVWAAVLFPQAAGEELPASKVIQAAGILKTEAEQLRTLWKGLKEPRLWHSPGSLVPMALDTAQAEEVRSLNVPSLQVLPYEQRYGGQLSGMQWLGYVSGQRKENLFYRDYEGVKGGSGLEKTLDPLLQGAGPTVVYYPVDGRTQVIHDLQPLVKAPNNPYYPLRFQTTVDAEIQKAIEALTEKAGIKEGAVVVLDASSGDIVAMVSRPFYHPERIYPAEGQWENRALKGVVPGSVFKIITAAAALEAGAASPDEHFHCSGEYGKYGLSCWKKGGHGTITFREGFAESCNVVFASLAERLAPEQLEEAAYRLGLGRTVGWEASQVLGQKLLRPLDHEEKGRIFAETANRQDAGTRVQTAIGQRDVSVSPLQAANMIVALLHDGKVPAPRILQSVSYANGQLLQSFPVMRRSGFAGISPKTTRILQRWMEDVVVRGTGSSLGRRSVWPLAGKSGTAETMVRGNARNNQWFVGYGPVKTPRYAVAVLVENMRPGSRHAATELFGQAMNYLASATREGSK